MAGLSAARKLQDKGFKVTVIEARDKTGGRIRTNRSLGFAFDEGASWIHGPNDNPISPLAAQAGANTFLTDDDRLQVFDVNGAVYPPAAVEDQYDLYEQALKDVAQQGSLNQSFETVFNGLFPQRAADRFWKYMLSAYLEFDTGSDLSLLSSQDFDDDEIFKGADVIITNGYDKVSDFLATGLTIQLNEKVTEIDYSGTTVKVRSNISTYEADYVLVTVPLGVLKRNIIQFSPALPTDKRQAITKTSMSAINKFILVWDTPFWDTNLQYIGYTPEMKGKFNYFLNVNKFSPVAALMTFAYGNYGLLTENMSDAAVTEAIMEHLRVIYGNAIPTPKNMLRTKWGNDEYTFGSYSFPTTGTRSTDFDVMAKAVENRLFFAGEHTERDYRGTVHGAYLSGSREADKIIDLQ